MLSGQLPESGRLLALPAVSLFFTGTIFHAKTPYTVEIFAFFRSAPGRFISALRLLHPTHIRH